MMIRQWIYLFCFLLVPVAHAQRSASFGDHEVHYIAYNSSFLNPDVAEVYGITRSKNRAMINISVQQGDVIGEGVAVELQGTATSILNQVVPLGFREIREGKAIYYVADVRFSDGDVLTFKVNALAEGQKRPYHVEWQQKFWQ